MNITIVTKEGIDFFKGVKNISKETEKECGIAIGPADDNGLMIFYDIETPEMVDGIFSVLCKRLEEAINSGKTGLFIDLSSYLKE